MMTFSERQAKIAELKRNNRAALSVALVSEGSISSTQINRMGKREHAEWQRNVRTHFEVKAEIRELSKSDVQIATETAKKNEAARQTKIDSAKRYIAMVEGLGGMSHGKNGKLKKGYQIAVDAELAKLAALEVA